MGTDDGNVQVTRDGGTNWENVRGNIPGIPETIWVSRVEASHFESGTAYVTFDGHRDDDFKPYIYKTTDYGRTWTDLSGTIPDGNSLYVVKEDYINRDLLFMILLQFFPPSIVTKQANSLPVNKRSLLI